MGAKGRPMFDLNELPPAQDDCDLPLPDVTEPQTSQHSSGPGAVFPVPPSTPGVLSHVSSLIPVPLVQSVDPAPLLPGQHPLSCFRPFVRPNPKNTVPEEPVGDVKATPDVKSRPIDLQDTDVKSRPIDLQDADVKSRPIDLQDADTVASSPSSASSGASSLQTSELKDSRTVTEEDDEMEKSKDDGMEDGEFGGSETTDGDHKEMVPRESEGGMKSTSVQQQPEDRKMLPEHAEGDSLRAFVDGSLGQAPELVETASEPKDRGEDNGITAAPDATNFGESILESMKEVQENEPTTTGCQAVTEAQGDAQLRSAPIDGLVKAEASRGHQSFAEGKFSSSFGKRVRSDQKDAMLGKKRSRQTMFLDVREAARQAAPLKSSTSRKNLSSAFPPRHNKDGPRTPLPQPTADKSWDSAARPKDQKSTPSPTSEVGKVGAGANLQESRKDNNTFSDGLQPGFSDAPKQCQVPLKKNAPATSDNIVEGLPSAVARHNSWKQGQGDEKQKQVQFSKPVGKYPMTAGQGKVGTEEKQSNFLRPLAKKNLNNFRKQAASGSVYHSQDTSIERLHREATCDKLWRSPGEAELQRVPGSFESVQEYVNVFEPLLFEECRAQLHSTWEESSDSVSKDAHVPVSIKSIEKRERGWYDVVLLPTEAQYRLAFKEGDVAVVSTPKPGSAGKSKRRSNGSGVSDSPEAEFSSRTAGIVRRYLPVDTRDPHGAILHFHVSESSAGSTSEDYVFKKFQCKGALWYLTVLGSLATTQREYVAIHAFQHLHSQMIKAILHPKADFFPRYEEEPPAMPDCFTQPYVQHLHKTFNGPQLAAIKWAAMHTAAGTSSSNGAGKRQDLWPFTLVQGPPGTGKTHTVWGMLNVIHLVQYQRYYAALLKKLAPDSLKSTDETANHIGSTYGDGTGSIDDVLQKMDQSLARILPKLCPKPRMLVCAPSNAATDEMLTRVLDRGFIDGEMKVYRPDVARVGIDTQSRASQAVSVERRSDQLLGMTREDVVGWLQQLRTREVVLAQQMAGLQKELSATAAAARSLGSVGVDPDVLAARDHTRDSKLQQLAAVVEERDKVLVEMSRLFIVDSRFRPGSGYSPEDARAKLEASFANEAEIVFTTVSSSGRRLFNHLTHGFDMVVIDEAAQASEVAVLPPLSLGAARCVLVGDPQQLPATVISRAAHTLQYSRSLFERFQQAGCPTMLLSVQYRMHPQIRDFPSRYFYQGRLVDSESISALPDEVYHRDPMLRPYVFYDISHGRESHKGGSVSYQNVPEAQFAAHLYEYLQNVIKTAGASKVSVGVITPYKLQLKCLQQEFGSVLGSDADNKAVYINTVDAFQGQERDVIIMSCVRASSHGVGFVADIRRMNVALTRARRSLWVIGNAAALVQSEDWAALIADAKERGCFVSMATSAVKGLLASKPNTFSPSQGRAPGLLRAPRPSGLIKGGPQDSDAEANSSHGIENRHAVGSVKTGIDRLAAQPTDLTADNTRSSDCTRDQWQASQRPNRGSSDQPFVGLSKTPQHLVRSDRNAAKQIRRSKGL